MPGLGLNLWTAEIPLVAYTLLILYRNILTGLRNVPSDVLDAARGMGMSRRQLLWRVELPLALPAIIAGVRIATVSTVALGTIAALVDNTGLGVPIISGILLQDRADRRRGTRGAAGDHRRRTAGGRAAVAHAVDADADGIASRR